ncbi:dynamin family protein [Leclercia adecarboxylata]|uniref:dynamin family protein n=1 Tax=Leclercia adecarboxylata TaxID=83655 RepID=UPI000579C75E|nr:dynamin family protein [Leclercia adecarboxylata]
MLKNQQQFVEYLKKLSTLLQESQISWDRNLLTQVENTQLLLPVIGAFSAGKSSLLNMFMGTTVLPVGIAPETELATELHFSKEPWLQAIRHDGSEERLAPEDLPQVNKKSAEYSHLRLYINSPALEAIAPLILVDMPGYGSSLENHNKALSYYLPRGVHFIVVTSVEDGTVTQSMLRNLDNIKTYESDFSFILSKTNLRAPEQVQEISTYIDEQLQLYFGTEKNIIALDNQSANALSDLLGQVDPERLFHNLFINRLKDQHFNLINQVNFATNIIKNNENSNADALRALEGSLAELIAQRDKTEREMNYRFSAPLVTRCINAIEHDLTNQVDRLAHISTTQNAAPALEREISDIIRGNLTGKIKREMDQISSELIDELSLSLAQNNAMMVTLDPNWVTNIAEKTEGKLKAVGSFLENISSNFAAKENAGKYYRLLSTVLAVTTNVLNPVLELVIVFLPDILRLFSASSAQERARANLLNTVFPGIKSEMRKALPAIVDEQLALLLNNVSNEFESQINQQKTLIAGYQHEQTQQQDVINQQLKTLQALLVEIKALATTYLYR